MNKAIPWSNDEINDLKKFYPILEKQELIKMFPNRSWKSVSGKAEKLKLNKVGDLKRNTWENFEIKILEDNYPTKTKEEILELLPDKTWSEIQHKTSRLNIRKYSEYKEPRRTWSDFEIKEIVENRGYKYISNYFDENNKRKIILECDKGIKDEVYLNNFKNGTNGGSHKITRRKEYNEVKFEIETENYVLLTEEKDYENNKSNLDLICPHGHKYTTTFGNFSSGKRCRQCYFDQMGQNRLLDKEILTDIFSEFNLVILNIEEYSGIDFELTCKCKTHGIVLMVSYNQLRNRKLPFCTECLHDEKITSYKEKYKNISKIFSDLNMNLLTTETQYMEQKNNK